MMLIYDWSLFVGEWLQFSWIDSCFTRLIFYNEYEVASLHVVIVGIHLCLFSVKLKDKNPLHNCALATTLEWRHNGHDGVSNHQPRHCLLNRLVRRRSKKTSKLRVTGLCAGNSPVTGEFPAQMASNAENVSIWWCHLEIQQLKSRHLPWLYVDFTCKHLTQWNHLTDRPPIGIFPTEPAGFRQIILIRKSKDYVYGIWVYKALGIWKGYYRVKKSLVSCMKPWTEARDYNKYMKSHSKLTYQLSF